MNVKVGDVEILRLLLPQNDMLTCHSNVAKWNEEFIFENNTKKYLSFMDYFTTHTTIKKILSSKKTEFGLEVLRRTPIHFIICLDFDGIKDSPEIDYGWKLLSKTLETMKNYAGKAGAELYVVFIPFEFQSSNILYERFTRKYGKDPSSIDLEKPNRRLAQLCERFDIACLDLLPAVKNAVSKGNQLYFIRDGHLNVDGHNFIYRILIPEKVFRKEKVLNAF
ncbi:hypothetical protein [Candidatus Scalindua japonica]|nr:hypothetical protein [Candidatus Scalindua japonica]